MKKKNQNKEAKKTQEDVDRWHNEIRKTKPKANKQKKIMRRVNIEIISSHQES